MSWLGAIRRGINHAGGIVLNCAARSDRKRTNKGQLLEPPDSSRNGRHLALSRSAPRCRRGAEIAQISVPSARVRASSTSTPRYLTVFSILVWPSRIWTARRLPVAL
jgi:hypothetical protein